MRTQPELLLRVHPFKENRVCKDSLPHYATPAGHRMFPVFAPACVPDEIKYADIHAQKKNRGRRLRRYIYIYLYIVYYNNVLCIAMVQELYTGR